MPRRTPVTGIRLDPNSGGWLGYSRELLQVPSPNHALIIIALPKPNAGGADVLIDRFRARVFIECHNLAQGRLM